MVHLIDFIPNQEQYKLLHYSKNQIVFNEQDHCDGIYLIIQGEVSIRTYNFFDQEYTITTLQDGSSFGESLLFSSRPYYLGNVIATKATTLLFLSKTELLALLQDSLFLTHFLLVLSERNLENQFKIKILL